MPGYDQSGPWGLGPLTGRGLGHCGRRNFGRRFSGRGFGWRRFASIDIEPTEPINLTKQEQKKILEAELKEIELEKQEIEKRLRNLNNAKTKKM